MKHEIVNMDDVQIIGFSKDIAFNAAHTQCPKFWAEFVENICNPVFVEHRQPDVLQQAAIDNGVGEFGLCVCDIPQHNCAKCSEQNFGTCSDKKFTYVIGGRYKGGNVPEGMRLFNVRGGRWLKVYFEGGISAYQQQFAKFHDEWLPAHSEYKWAGESACMEWYEGADIQSPDYQCGILMPLK